MISTASKLVKLCCSAVSKRLADRQAVVKGPDKMAYMGYCDQSHLICSGLRRKVSSYWWRWTETLHLKHFEQQCYVAKHGLNNLVILCRLQDMIEYPPLLFLPHGLCELVDGTRVSLSLDKQVDSSSRVRGDRFQSLLHTRDFERLVRCNQCVEYR